MVGTGVDPVTSRLSGARGSFVADLAFAIHTADLQVVRYFSPLRAWPLVTCVHHDLPALLARIWHAAALGKTVTPHSYRPRDVPAGMFTIEFFEDSRGRSPVERWMESDLTDLELAALIAALEQVLSHRGINVCGTEWGKQLGDGLFEFRVRHTAEEIQHMFGETPLPGGRGGRVLLRVFCHAYGDKVVLLLNGYDKGEDPSDKRQRREVRTARKRLAEFKDRQARERKGARKRSCKG